MGPEGSAAHVIIHVDSEAGTLGLSSRKPLLYRVTAQLFLVYTESVLLCPQNQQCKFNPANVGATDTGFVDIKSKSESDLQSAVATVGPVSVAIDASHASFQLYR